eukprot:scaffold3067_cov67-Phaeocystis_antarctica.AAC.9
MGSSIFRAWQLDPIRTMKAAFTGRSWARLCTFLSARPDGHLRPPLPWHAARLRRHSATLCKARSGELAISQAGRKTPAAALCSIHELACVVAAEVCGSVQSNTNIQQYEQPDAVELHYPSVGAKAATRDVGKVVQQQKYALQRGTSLLYSCISSVYARTRIHLREPAQTRGPYPYGIKYEATDSTSRGVSAQAHTFFSVALLCVLSGIHVLRVHPIVLESRAMGTPFGYSLQPAPTARRGRRNESAGSSRHE